jgi:hypothetical protein
MSLPNKTTYDDEDLVRYVLGFLSDDAAERLDEASIVDDEVAVRLHTVETDLVDSYARGQLAGETLQRFESYYLASPRRRQQANAAARFVYAIDRSATDVEAVQWKSRLARPGSVVRLGVAAALVVLASAILLVRVTRAPSEPTVASGETGAPAPPTTTAPRVRSSEQTATAAPGPAVPALRTTGSLPTRPQGRIAAIVLFPPTRDLTAVPTLALPADADRVRFELRLESNDFQRYRVELKNLATERVLWRSDWMPASEDRASISAVVPVALLRAEHYSLDLTGQASGGRTEVIGSYTVRIAAP